jgi:hypothetical protein
MIKIPKLGREEKKVKNKRILAVSLLCIALISLITVGVWGLLSRAATSSVAASQFGEIEQDGTSLHMTLYGDPEGARGAFEMFQYVELHDLTWRGALPKPYPPQPGPPPPEGDIELELSSVEFRKVGENDWTGEVEGLNLHVVANDLVNVVVQADNVDVELEFWTSHDLPALNVTAELTGNVYVYLYASVLPLQGLQLALYEFSGDYFVISVTVIKPMEIALENPVEGDRVIGNVQVPGISVERVDWWAEGKEDWNKDCRFEDSMWYDEIDGLWKADWHTWHGGNGWYALQAKAEAVQEGGFRYWDEETISVETDNPWVESWVKHPDGDEQFDGLEIELEKNGNFWHWQTGFNLPPWMDVSLTAPGEWWDGNIQFQSWIIMDEAGNKIFESDNPTLMIGDVYAYLVNGRARPLRCIYVETPQP